MRALILLSIILTCSSLSVFGQVLKGAVVNDSGEPIPYAVMFIKELAQGTGANRHGYFEVKVKSGVYHCSFQSIGHQTLEQAVEVKPEGTELKIVLVEKPYMLAEAVVGIGKSEDPAYRIMRKAIGMAPYYLNQVSEYRSNVYLKGTLVVDKISGLVKAAAGKQINEAGVKEKEEYLQESVNEVIFRVPDEYEQNIKSVSSTFPDGMGNFYFTNIRFNIYNPENNLFISPLSSAAFANYNFKHEGVSLEGKHVINKIKVIPKIKSKLLLEGYLYIDEDSYSIWEFDLSGESVGIEFRNRQSFAEVFDDVFLPINYLMDFNISMLGNKATIAYRSVVKYDEVKVNPNADKFLASSALIDTAHTQSFQGEKMQGLNTQIEELLSKASFTNRDAIKLSNLMSKSMKKAHRADMSSEEKRKDPLELVNKLKINVDSLAKKQDSTYWAENRPIPLSIEERKSYTRKDSLNKAGRDSTGKRIKKNFSVGDLFGGNRYFLCDSSAYLSHNGLTNPFDLNFNPVDGFVYGQELSFSKRFKDTTSFRAILKGQYALSRKVLLGSLALSYSYWPEKRASIRIEGGRRSADFNESGISPYGNMLIALAVHKSYIKLYDDKYIAISHSIDIANGLTFNLKGTFSDRTRLENTTNFSVFARSKDYEENTPNNSSVISNPTLLDDMRTTIIKAKLSYTPQYYYRKYGRIKHMVRSDYPTFSIGWKKGIPDVFDSQADFDMGIASIRQEVDLGIFRSLTYSLEGAKFFNRKEMHFADFRHFNIQEPMVLFGSLSNGALYLPPMYSASTNDWYLSASVIYKTPYLMLKYLPFFSNTYWQEGLQLSYLRTPAIRSYTEVGYSLTDIALLFGVGVYVGFNDFKYNSVGVKFSLALTLSDR